MRGTILLFLLCSLEVSAVASSRFDLAGYQHADGAISLGYYSDYVEPYFATKALIVASDAGLDVHDVAERWIAWLLPRQDKHGRFGRYCRKPGQEWTLCAAADADDSMLALWLQLLYLNAPDTGLPATWQRSASKAKAALDELRNARLGVYHVSTQNHVALFMDNVEVYSGLEAVSRAQQRFGQVQAARTTLAEAEKLDAAIQRVFWNKHAEWFRPSIQKSRPEFYPDVVAQVYPWLADMPMDSNVPTRDAWTGWKQRFAADWLNKRFDPHPWGLVAVAAEKFGDNDSAACWLSRSEPLRFSNNWNVLEEAAFQVIESQIGKTSTVNPSACSRVAATQ
ncbi:MAG: hypothetical protein JOZ10_10820 [Acidobacteria bacterium]|nr:hypothetical protein [Acidobacteriota bacterium]MBV9148088.1 hypothetical protein [Acidobacteriota bacterium]MBV9437591.1 hypothetical protein [Acidobacteriota bacterium]